MSIEPSKLKARCPACKQWARWADNSFRPFCSESCKKRDLGNWAMEKYRIPVVDEEVEEGAKERLAQRKDDGD